MAVRNDVTLNWESSPREVTIDAPSTEISMQDLLDTLRHNEALDSNIDNPSIVEGSGKVVLDDQGNAVGLTVQLINATVGFETRPGPEWIECSLAGGNLSGLEADKVTVTTKVTHNNAFVNINKTSSVSATISESNVSNSLDYGGTLYYDENNVSGTGQSHPIGTLSNPVNNIEDGVVIATLYSLNDVVTYSDVNIDRDLSRFNVSSAFNDTTFYPHGFKMMNCSLNHMMIDGDFNDSFIHLHNCTIINALNIYGKIKDCFLAGNILISANQDLTVTDSESGIAGQGSSTIDMKANEDTTLSLRNYSGGVTLENCDTPACVTTLELNQGKPHLEPSCTDGYISVRGVAALDDRSNGSTIDVSALWDPTTMGSILDDILSLTGHNITRVGDVITIYEKDEITVWRQYNLANQGRIKV